MSSALMQIGVCYYPEHWPESQWTEDARRMVETGISVVRIGEFAWSRLEPSDGQLQLEWLQRALDTLLSAGLQVVLGTPTASPPKWLVDKYPDMLAVDESGHQRKFGSRRHYCFSSATYRRECRRIVQILAEQFGHHKAVVAWQTDNEYGCHDTIISYSDAAKAGFRRWCSQRYSSIDELNQKWGNVFWSMEYNSFDQIDPPNSTVTEPNPSHSLSFWQFSTDQVKAFNKLQTGILRKLSPGRDLVHNYMGNFTAFDHYQVAEDLDVAAWDNYPLGFLDRDDHDPKSRAQWLRTGHPDSSAFHHDLYRGIGRGRWWVMEQQPGPVNWAPHNPSPLEGMVRLWGLEALAHGAEVMSYFRWRQYPAAQEQLHSGLCLSNGEPDTAAAEVSTLARNIKQLQQSNVTLTTTIAPVALVFDYTGDQLQRLTGIGGAAHDPLIQVQAIYSACRQSGLNVDIVPTSADLSAYSIILVTNCMTSNGNLLASLKQSAASIVLFPGTGSRTPDCAIHEDLPPGQFVTLINLRVTRTESLPDFMMPSVTVGDDSFTAHHWRERISSELVPAGYFNDGWGFYYHHDNVHYVNAHLDTPSLTIFLRQRFLEAGIAIEECNAGLRYRKFGNLRFAFNYGPGTVELSPTNDYVLGQKHLSVGGVAAWVG